MKPNLNAPDTASKEASKKISECALEQKVVPGCVKTLWGGQIQAIIESQKGRTRPPLRRSPGTGEPEPHDKQ